MYDDVRHFMHAMALIQDGGDAAAILEREYFGKATPGLEQFVIKYGLTADCVPTRYTVHDILAEIGDIGGRHILIPQGREAWPHPVSTLKTNLTNTLRSQGAVVEAVIAYEILPVEPDPAAMSALLDGGVDVAVFISPSGVAGLVAMLDGRLLADRLSPLIVACLGPATADAARALGMQVDIIAEEFTIAGLIEALVKWRKNG